MASASYTLPDGYKKADVAFVSDRVFMRDNTIWSLDGKHCLYSPPPPDLPPVDFVPPPPATPTVSQVVEAAKDEIAKTFAAPNLTATEVRERIAGKRGKHEGRPKKSTDGIKVAAPRMHGHVQTLDEVNARGAYTPRTLDEVNGLK